MEAKLTGTEERLKGLIFPLDGDSEESAGDERSDRQS